MGVMSEPRAQHITAIAALNDPQRQALYDFVRRNAQPVTRDEAAEALAVPRSTAAFHLDRLVSTGLLEVEFKRLSGKTGPGSGRPAKLYRHADTEITVSVPPRQYELAAELLAQALQVSDATGEPVRDALLEIATDTGTKLGASAGSMDAALTSCGYEPRDDGEGGALLSNCPFDRLAARHTDLICHTNVALLEGVARGAGETERTVQFTPPANGHCCVRLVKGQ